MTMHQHTPDYPDDDTFRIALIRGINAAMAGDREAMERATADIHAVTPLHPAGWCSSMRTRTTTSPARRDQDQPQQRRSPRLTHRIHHRDVDGTVHAMCGQVLRNARGHHPGDKINCAACDAALHLLGSCHDPAAPPQDDQPDTYSGIHNRTRVRWVSADLTHGVYHLCIHTSDDEYQQRRGTYCTRLNPVHTFDISNTRTANAAGESLYYPRQGATAGQLLTQQPLYGYQDRHLTPCPDCLTLAAVQAEMRGQNTYPVVGLCQQLQRLPDQQHQA